jgi:hypothetical protein
MPNCGWPASVQWPSYSPFTSKNRGANSDFVLSRRQFLPALGLPAAASLFSGVSPALGSASGEQNKNPLVVARNYFLKSGSQPERLHDFLKKALLPQLAHSPMGPPIILDALIAAHMPQVMTLFGFRSVEQWRAAEEKLVGLSSYRDALEQWERGDDGPYEEYSERLLDATPFSPPLPTAQGNDQPRIFELRVYHSPTSRQLTALNERFEGKEIGIFHRSGIHPILYTNAVTGDHLPNLTYLIPFDSLAAREKAWAAFAADPEWVKVRAESVQKFGQITSVIEMSIWRATPYSPVR